MADISTLMGVNVDTLSKYCGVDSDTINTVMGLTWPHGPRGPQYVGEFWGGGYYFGTLGSYYLIVYYYSSVSGYKWQDPATLVTGSDSTTDGYSNLQDMITAGISTFPSGNYCNNFVADSLTDWYLPAVDELSLLYANKSTLESYGLSFAADRHWSSTEYNASYAYTINFINGTKEYRSKIVTDTYTRPIRRVAI